MQVDVRAPNKRALKAAIKAREEEEKRAETEAEPTAVVECELNDAARALLSGPKAEALTFNDFCELNARNGLPTFPIEVLPAWVANWAEAAAEAEQVPLDIAATLGLAAISTATMSRAKVGMYGGEPLNGYFVLIDRSGANKSGIFATALRPIHEWAASVQLSLTAQNTEWEVDVAILEAKVSALKKALGTARQGGDKIDKLLNAGDAKEKLQDAMAELQQRIERKPRGDIRLCGDVTPERTADLLAFNRSVAQLSPEGAEIFEGMGRYQQKGDKSDVYLKSWKGDRLMVDRKNGTQLSVDEPTLTIVSAAQPQVLETLRDPNGAREGRGLFARFFWSVPESKVGYRQLVRDRVAPAVASTYAAGIRCLTDLPYPEGPTPEIVMSEDGWDVARDFYDEIERELRPGAGLVDVEAFASKIRSHHARVAGWLHLADGRGIADEISGDTMTRALTLTRYFLAHGKAAHGMMSPDEDTAKALRLWPKVARLAEREGAPAPELGGATAIDKRSIVMLVKKDRGFGNTSDVDSALGTLEEHGYIQRFNRRRAQWLAINPLVWVVGVSRG